MLFYVLRGNRQRPNYPSHCSGRLRVVLLSAHAELLSPAGAPRAQFARRLTGLRRRAAYANKKVINTVILSLMLKSAEIQEC